MTFKGLSGYALAHGCVYTHTLYKCLSLSEHIACLWYDGSKPRKFQSKEHILKCHSPIFATLFSFFAPLKKPVVFSIVNLCININKTAHKCFWTISWSISQRSSSSFTVEEFCFGFIIVFSQTEQLFSHTSHPDIIIYSLILKILNSWPEKTGRAEPRAAAENSCQSYLTAQSPPTPPKAKPSSFYLNN